MCRPVRIALKTTIIYVVFSLIAGFVLTEMSLRPGRTHPNQTRISEMYAQYGAKLDPVSIHASDGIELRAWYSVPAHDNGRAVILLHGIGDNRGGVAGYGQEFLAHGYRVLLPDSRAHGESGGELATYGLRESDDIHRWVSWLYDHGATCVNGLGESMGAALVLESLAAESRFCAVVADSGFATFRSVAYDREGYFIGLGRVGLERWFGRTIGFLPAEVGLHYAKWRYGVDLFQANPVDALRNSSTPVLLIHGDADINILPDHSRVLAVANSKAEFWLVPGAVHCGAAGKAPQEFWPRVLGFFQSYNSVSHASGLAP
jgi:pimeloyl-ACP methyl ester carboxylesterase